MKIHRINRKIYFYQSKGYHLYEIEKGNGSPLENVTKYIELRQKLSGKIDEVYYRVVKHPIYDTIEIYVKYANGGGHEHNQ